MLFFKNTENRTLFQFVEVRPIDFSVLVNKEETFAEQSFPLPDQLLASREDPGTPHLSPI